VIIHATTKTLKLDGGVYPCRIGRGGYVNSAQGREGDEKTPLGDYILRFGLYRADRLPKPRSLLTFRTLREDDGWCDDPNDPAYNRFIRLPYPASHERLWRDDWAYDIILIISHNDNPPQAGKGSAVFIHIAQPDDRETLGCVAVTPDVIADILPRLTPGMAVRIVA